MSPPIISTINLRWMRLTGHLERMRAKRNVNRILVEEPQVMRTQGRPRRKWGSFASVMPEGEQSFASTSSCQYGSIDSLAGS